MDLTKEAANPEENINNSKENQLCNRNANKDENSSVERRTNVLEEIADSYRSILFNVGEDTNRPGLLSTPMRAAKSLLYYTKGYEENIEGNNMPLLCQKFYVNYFARMLSRSLPSKYLFH